MQGVFSGFVVEGVELYRGFWERDGEWGGVDGFFGASGGFEDREDVVGCWTVCAVGCVVLWVLLASLRPFIV